MDEPDRAIILLRLVDVALETKDWSPVETYITRYSSDKRKSSYLLLAAICRAKGALPLDLVQNQIIAKKTNLKRHDEYVASTPSECDK